MFLIEAAFKFFTYLMLAIMTMLALPHFVARVADIMCSKLGPVWSNIVVEFMK